MFDAMSVSMFLVKSIFRWQIYQKSATIQRVSCLLPTATKARIVRGGGVVGARTRAHTVSKTT